MLTPYVGSNPMLVWPGIEHFKWLFIREAKHTGIYTRNLFTSEYFVDFQFWLKLYIFGCYALREGEVKTFLNVTLLKQNIYRQQKVSSIIFDGLKVNWQIFSH